MESMRAERGNGRLEPRRPKYLCQGLKISAYFPPSAPGDEDWTRSAAKPHDHTRRRHWVAAARVVDVGEEGLQVEMLKPLAVGLSVSVAGELHSIGWCVRLTARAKVTFCQNITEGAYRVGFEFQQVSYRALHCTHRQAWPFLNPAAPAVTG